MKTEIFTPGRTELAGNHTDHQLGRILASGVNLGLTVQAEKSEDNIIKIESTGFAEINVHINKKMFPRTDEFGTSKALVRGVVEAYSQLGLQTGGFHAIVTSSLPAGGGLSSSAAFAVTIGKLLNIFYNNNEVDPIVIARAAQKAENEFFGKPCGLMDQLACSLGHTVYVDFKTNEIEPIQVDFEEMGLTLCLTDTGGSHAGLDSSYARIPADMHLVAAMFDKEFLADVEFEKFKEKGWNISDRPVRRAMHFFYENARVPQMRDALIKRDAETYLRLMNESGRSSEQLLNNIFTSASGDTKLQDGIDLSAELLNGKGAWRVHGGGFAGFVQALMPIDYFKVYKEKMEEKFGVGSCHEIKLI